MLEIGGSIDQASAVIVGTGYSRIPVYEGTIDNIVGILTTKDLLAHLRDNGDSRPKLTAILGPAHFVPEKNKVDELLEEFYCWPTSTRSKKYNN